MAVKRNSKNRKAGATSTKPRKSKKNNTSSWTTNYPGYCGGQQESARRLRRGDGRDYVQPRMS